VHHCNSCASACNTATTPTQPHRKSNTHRTKENTTSVVIQPNSRKLLLMDILMFETCWAHKKWNKIPNDIKLVFYSWSFILLLFSCFYMKSNKKLCLSLPAYLLVSPASTTQIFLPLLQDISHTNLIELSRLLTFGIRTKFQVITLGVFKLYRIFIDVPFCV